MAIIRTASNVNDRLPRDAALDETIIKCYNVIVARDSPAEQWSLLRKFALGAQALETNIFPDSRVRDMYWELWNELAPNYHNDGCKSNLYQPLGKYKIRLVSLIKHDGDKLVCRLDRYPQWLAPEYDALSYAWGNSTDTTTIICNGIELSISTALHVALRHLLEGAVRSLRPLWIDAICLNQQDDDEKAHQVPCIGKIFMLARRTLIWLGEAADESDKAMEFLRNLDQKTRIGVHTHEEEARLTYSQTIQNGRPITDSILSLLQRSWFSRLWTMQEAALSQSCQVVCGGTSLDWSAFPTFNATLDKLELGPLEHTPGPIGPIYWMYFMRTIDVLEDWRLAVRKNMTLSVHALLVLGEWKNCKEAVDRIWAISALFPYSLRQRIREADIIDYSASGRNEYWKTYLSFLKLLYVQSPEELWSVIVYGQGLAKNVNLPSWCPDFNATRQCNVFSCTGTEYRAGFPDAKSSITHTLILSPGSTVLTVKGFTFDTVQSVTQHTITTTQGRIGYAMPDMRSGDMVCIVEGAEMVFVLRRVDHDTVRSSGIHSQEDLDQYPELFSLVGDTKIHGCMYGEAFTASDRGPDREFALV